MNISHLMRSLLGEQTVGDSRTLELKVGQTVRGVVSQLLDNNEAIVQIQGVQVRAKLESPLQAGQTAFLQVQPQSSGSTIIMKQVDPVAAGMLDDTFRDIAKKFGLPDQKWAVELVKDLRQEGFTFNRATAAAFQQAASLLPPGANMEQWMQAAAAAFKRGMPMTAATISAMQQIMFGQPQHELLQSLRNMLSGALANQSASLASSGAGSTAFLQAAAKVLSLLDASNSFLQGLTSSGKGVTSGMAASLQQAGSVGGALNHLQGEGNMPGQGGGTAQAAQASQSQPANWLGGMMKWLGVDHELQLAKQATKQYSEQLQQASSSGRGGLQAAAQAPAQAANTANAAILNNGAAQQATAATVPQPQTGPQAPSARKAQMTNQAGASASSGGAQQSALQPPAQSLQAQPGQQQATAAAQASAANTSAAAPGGSQAMQTDLQPPAPSGSALQHQQAAAPASPAHASGHPLAADARMLQNSLEAAAVMHRSAAHAEPIQAAESLKGALLQLIAAADTPAAAKELANQLVSQITGQQLMLTAERNNSLFTHITMYIPLQDQEGGQTASVHVQTRRGRKGELDAENCRLLFNLSMKTIGETIIDVFVADRMVSLHIWNDHPATAELTEATRLTMAERMQQIGYQLSSLKVTAMPDESKQEEADAAVESKHKPKLAPPDSSLFSATRYKGVDFKV